MTPAVYRTMQEIVYASIRERILSGEFAAGQRITIEELAQELGTSPMPVREALKRLEATGLVDIVPHRGAMVSDLSEREIIEVYHIRGVLEGLVVRLAGPHLSSTDYERLDLLTNDLMKAAREDDVHEADRLNVEFHNALWLAADSPRLREILANLTDVSQHFRKASLTTPGRVNQIVREHRSILDALKDGDPVKAERLAVEHYETTAKRLLEAFGREKAVL